MIYIHKNTEPVKFRWYRQQKDASFDHMDTDVKEELRGSLLKEQGHLCAYCLSRIKSVNDVKIEHYEARTKDNELVYQNLLAVCKGNEGQPTELQTCDTKKGNQSICISPLSSADMDTIFYLNNGKIHSTDSDKNKDIEYKLNLNHKKGFLVTNRRTALQTVRKMMKKNLRQGQNAEKFLLKLQKMYGVHNEYLEPYVGIIRWYVSKKLKNR